MENFYIKKIFNIYINNHMYKNYKIEDDIINESFKIKNIPKIIAENYDPIYFIKFYNNNNLSILDYLPLEKQFKFLYKEELLKELIRNIGKEEIKKWMTNINGLTITSKENIYTLIKNDLIEKDFLNEVHKINGKKVPFYYYFFNTKYEKEIEAFLPILDFNLIEENLLTDIFYKCRRDPAFTKLILNILPENTLLSLNENNESLLHVIVDNMNSFHEAISFFTKKGLPLDILNDKGGTFISKIEDPKLLFFIINNNDFFNIHDAKNSLLKKDLMLKEIPFLNYQLIEEEKKRICSKLNNLSNENIIKKRI